MKKIISFIILLSALTSAQIYNSEDVEICKSKFDLAVDKNMQEMPIGDVIAEVGKSFLGLGYEAHTLEADGEEQLVIHLTGLDCTTFLENCLTLARCIKANETSFEDYQKHLTLIRYRGGKIDKYPSRLHYFSDWIFDNTKKGIVTDVTKNIGGEPIKFNVSFMSTHPDSYKKLKEINSYIPAISKYEDDINAREYFYIPNEKVEEHESEINNGDLIAITTNLTGLDIGHVGVAVKLDDGRIHFMHAPLVGAKVQISEDPIGDYLAKVKKHTGIIVLRAVEP
ncbi:MAG: DUF1460 domain-containing protein [Ignavibacteriaceae bacterium]|nr:DUF1460 domain-containing protein [Ignavibacteriaceae bacterium]